MAIRLPAPSSFFAELRRRHVVRVALAYGVVGWLVFEIASEGFPALGLPDWSVTLVLALLLVAFPLALALAWAFDVTPQGITRASEAAVADGGAALPSHARISTTSPAASSQRVTEAGAPYRGRRVAEEAGARPGIAVLPFVNMSGDPENEYFSDGVAEDVLTQLSRIEGLRVVSRTTAMRYKGSGKSVAEIADELDVPAVLEGSVRRSGDRVRITAQLIDARSDGHLWAETFDRGIEDIFEVQSEVARSIARALRTELSPRDEARLRRRPTIDMEAYNLVLRGRAHGTRFLPSEFATAIRLFRAATELDPGYASAYAHLAGIYSVTGLMQFRPLAELYEPGLAAARKAIELDPDLAEAHMAIAALKMLCEWDWEGTESALERALLLEPEHSDTLAWKALYLLTRERTSAALASARRSAFLAPHDLSAVHVLVQVLIMTERLDEAIDLLDRTLELDPGFAVGRYWRAYALAASGRAREAEAEFKELVDQGALPPLWEAVRGSMIASLGREAEAREVLQDLEARRSRGEVMGDYGFFSLRIALGDYDLALDHLEAALEAREAPILYSRVAPRFRSLRAHPRFQRVLATIWPDDFAAEGGGALRAGP